MTMTNDYERIYQSIEHCDPLSVVANKFSFNCGYGSGITCKNFKMSSLQVRNFFSFLLTNSNEILHILHKAQFFYTVVIILDFTVFRNYAKW